MRADHAQCCQHIRSRRAQLRFPRPVSLGDYVTQKPDERLRCSLLRDDPYSHCAELGIELAPIDPLLDQFYSGARTSLLRHAQAGEYDSVVRVRESAHDSLVAFGWIPKKQSHRLSADQRLFAVQESAHRKPGRQCRETAKKSQQLTLQHWGGRRDFCRYRRPHLIAERLYQVV